MPGKSVTRNNTGTPPSRERLRELDLVNLSVIKLHQSVNNRQSAGVLIFCHAVACGTLNTYAASLTGYKSPPHLVFLTDSSNVKLIDVKDGYNSKQCV